MSLLEQRNRRHFGRLQVTQLAHAFNLCCGLLHDFIGNLEFLSESADGAIVLVLRGCVKEKALNGAPEGASQGAGFWIAHHTGRRPDKKIHADRRPLQLEVFDKKFNQSFIGREAFPQRGKFNSEPLP